MDRRVAGRVGRTRSALWAEHGGVLLSASLATLAVATILGHGRRPDLRTVGRILCVLLLLDLLGSFAAVFVVGELTIASLPVVFLVLSGLGTQVIAAGVGLLAGRSLRAQDRRGT